MTILVVHLELVAGLVHLALALENHIDDVLVDEGTFLAQSLHIKRAHELHVIDKLRYVDSDSTQLLEELELISQAVLAPLNLLLRDQMLVAENILDEREVLL